MFVQQLGRGLRRAADKEYVIVLDFIGNYEKNYLIATALSDDRSYSKEKLRRFVTTGAERIPAASDVYKRQPPSTLTRWPAAVFIGQLTAHP